MKVDDKIKLFGMSQFIIERDLDKIEQKFKVDFQRNEKNVEKDDVYYPQFTQALRQEAAEMAKYYELFYCLEKNIRNLVAETLKGVCGENWWEKSVPDEIRKNVKENMQRELDSGITLRSDDEIDYTTFGELSTLVQKNWDNFPMFSSVKAFSKIMNSLNTLRGPIAHCCALTEDEVIRLKLTIKDWFRLME